MPNVTKAEDETVVNVTFQLKGEEAELLEAYQSKEYLRTLSSAARKGLLEYLNSLKGKGKLPVSTQTVEARA
jgi:retron-type reverse transcriptase